MFGRGLLAPTVALVALSCGGDQHLEPRFVAVHNAMTAMGLVQAGPISEGSLAEGHVVRVDVNLEAGQCYTVLALGYDGVVDLDVRVTEEAGEEIGRDATRDAQAVSQVCPARSGPHHIIVAMLAGSGGYSLAAWSTPVSNGGLARTTTRPRGGIHGTCSEPIDLDVGQTVEGDTRQGAANLRGSCSAGLAQEQVYRIQVDQVTKFTATVQTTFDGALYLQQECGGRQSEVACNDDAPNSSRSEVEATLQPGTYYLVVDGYAEEAGEYELTVVSTPLRTVQEVCADAQRLVPGKPVTGTTRGSANYFQASCAGGSRSSDRVFRLAVPRRSRVRVRQQTDHDGSLYMRRACDDPATEVICNDDFRDQKHALIANVYDAGEYYVYTDGFSPSQTGSFTLTAEIAPEAGGQAAGEQCDAPGEIAPGIPSRIDTFAARDDATGSCGGAGAPDAAQRLVVAAKSRLRVTVREPEFNGYVYLRSACADAGSELVCMPLPIGRETALDVEVNPGEYFLFVDGATPESFGSARVEVRLDDLADLSRTCRAAIPLRPGRQLVGNTEGAPDSFQAACAGGARSPDRVYRLRVPEKVYAKIRLATEFDGALHLRRDCMDVETTVACNDDHGDSKHSAIQQLLDPGTYYVVVDGFRTGNTGNYAIEVEFLPPKAAETIVMPPEPPKDQKKK